MGHYASEAGWDMSPKDLPMQGENLEHIVELTAVNGRLIHPEQDMVNHPPHYTTGKIEVIDFILDQKFTYLEGQVIKYISRAKHKGNELEDKKKAAFYLAADIRQLEEANAN